MITTMIFDLDGTLVQTERLKAISYAKAAVQLCPRHLEENEVIEAFKDVVGLSRREVALGLMEQFELEEAARTRMAEFGVDTPWQAYVQVRLHIYEEMLADPEVIRHNQWLHNVALLEEARRNCRHVGLATMSYCPQVRRVLQILELDNAFDFVASRDDVERGKPDPEIYLLVAAELDVVAGGEAGFKEEERPFRLRHRHPVYHHLYLTRTWHHIDPFIGVTRMNKHLFLFLKPMVHLMPRQGNIPFEFRLIGVMISGSFHLLTVYR